MRIVLASRSPRRRGLLKELGLDFVVVPSDVSEDHPRGSSPREVAKHLADLKASDVARSIRDGLVIGADTIVVLDGRILGKPVDDEDALNMLKSLRGTTHRVITGIAVLEVAGGYVRRKVVDAVETDVTMRDVSDEELRAYVATGESVDKAGGYAVQERGDRFISCLRGSYTNVVGLPMERLEEILGEFGLNVRWMGQ
ncbi:MAG: Maf family protein [bacterium]